MNITVYFAVAVAVCLCITEGAPEGRMTRKQQRPTRGFKNVEMMTARGFGKRARTEHDEIREIRGSFKPNSNILIARGYGKRQESNGVYGMDNFWENLEASQEKDGQDSDDKTLQSIPQDWFTNEMAINPEFARSVVRKFIDLNQDGMLSSDELLRNV